mmetsp:Transcript_34872/g.81506  ORF Transcript_34872/g.81506 Transcript_34872/m.81506 type:complete len:1142 (+) Transcript_34872:51-3476(+)
MLSPPIWPETQAANSSAQPGLDTFGIAALKGGAGNMVVDEFSSQTLALNSLLARQAPCDSSAGLPNDRTPGRWPHARGPVGQGPPGPNRPSDERTMAQHHSSQPMWLAQGLGYPNPQGEGETAQAAAADWQRQQQAATVRQAANMLSHFPPHMPRDQANMLQETIHHMHNGANFPDMCPADAAQGYQWALQHAQLQKQIAAAEDTVRKTGSDMKDEEVASHADKKRCEELQSYIKQQSAEFLEQQAEWQAQMATLSTKHQDSLKARQREKDEVESQARSEIMRLRQLLIAHGIKDEASSGGTQLLNRQRGLGSWADAVGMEEHRQLQKTLTATEERVKHLEAYIKDHSTKTWELEEQLKQARVTNDQLQQVVLRSSMETQEANQQVEALKTMHRDVMTNVERDMRRMLNGAEKILGISAEQPRQATQVSLNITKQEGENGDVASLRKMLKDVLVSKPDQRSNARDRSHLNGGRNARRAKLKEVNEDLDVQLIAVFNSFSLENGEVVDIARAQEAAQNWYVREVVWLDDSQDDVKQAFSEAFSDKDRLSLEDFRDCVQKAERGMCRKIIASSAKKDAEKETAEMKKLIAAHFSQSREGKFSKENVLDLCKEVALRFCARAEDKRLVRWCSFILRWHKDASDPSKAVGGESQAGEPPEDVSQESENEVLQALLLAHPVNPAWERPTPIETCKPDSAQATGDAANSEGNLSPTLSPVRCGGGFIDSNPSSRDTSPGRGHGNGHVKTSQGFLSSSVPFLTHLVNDIRALLQTSAQAAAKVGLSMPGPSAGPMSPSTGLPSPGQALSQSPMPIGTPPALLEPIAEASPQVERVTNGVPGQAAQGASDQDPQSSAIQESELCLNAMPPGNQPVQPLIMTPQEQEQASRQMMVHLFAQMLPARQNIAELIVATEKNLRALQKELNKQCQEIFANAPQAATGDGGVEVPLQPEVEALAVVPLPEEVQMRGVTTLRKVQYHTNHLLSEYVQLPARMKGLFTWLNDLQTEVDRYMVPKVCLLQAEDQAHQAHLEARRQVFESEILNQRLEALKSHIEDLKLRAAATPEEADPQEDAVENEEANLKEDLLRMKAQLTAQQKEFDKLHQALVQKCLAHHQTLQQQQQRDTFLRSMPQYATTAAPGVQQMAAVA